MNHSDTKDRKMAIIKRALKRVADYSEPIYFDEKIFQDEAEKLYKNLQALEREERKRRGPSWNI